MDVEFVKKVLSGEILNDEVWELAIEKEMQKNNVNRETAIHILDEKFYKLWKRKVIFGTGWIEK